MKANEKIICISNGRKTGTHVFRGLQERGWEITVVSDPRAALSACVSEGFDIGIVCLEAFHLDECDNFEHLINDLDVRMIAIAEKEVMDEIRHYQSIGKLFFGYHAYPIDVDSLHHSLENLQSIVNMEKECREQEGHRAQGECLMVGSSPAMTSLFKAIHKIAAVDAPVLIQGESGTGKELAARAIHRESSRFKAPFNAINCGALPGNLIQSELFGHEKGSFTGASQRKIGILEHTDGGTLFLDEIGDLPLDMQVNLLRFLENSTIQRVGGLKEIEIGLRVLAATHVDLEKAVQEGKFREDLFHRINVLQIHVPPLRERGEDIAVLSHYFFKKFSSEKSCIVNGFSKDSLAVMQQYEWPGNIRELINRVRRAMVMSEHPLIRPIDLGLERRQSTSRHASSLEEARDMAERGVVMASLKRNAFNIKDTSRELGVSRVTLYRLMEKHDIHRHKRPPEEMLKGSPKDKLSKNILSFRRKESDT